MSSELADILIRRIKTNGPISVAEFMAECLLHPEHGYYSTRDPFGQSGDFTTAPEISQMFGELIGLSLAQNWLDQGQPSPFVLAELGPGRGTLMADFLRATKSVPGFHDGMNVCLIEASPALKQIQRATLPDVHITWVDTVSDLPEMPLWVVANEFFDALPIRQFERTHASWCERQIAISEEGQLGLGLGRETNFADLVPRLADTQAGDIVEVCPSAKGIAFEIGTRIQSAGGAALFVDYGDWHSLGDTLQAVRNHKYCNPLEHAGQADLTAHVDFEALALAAACAHSRLTPQGLFLERLGITQRAQSLAQNLRDAKLDQHIAAHRRLTHPEEMGTLFKVLALYPEGMLPPPGLEK